jgi:hypothetical protein
MNFSAKGSDALKYMAIILLTASLFLNGIHFKQVGKERDMIHDVRILQEHIPPGSTITVPAGLWGDWALHAYLQRKAGISLDGTQPVTQPFLLVERGTVTGIPDGFVKEPLELSMYELYRRGSGSHPSTDPLKH